LITRLRRQRRYETGDFCWVGLATSNPGAAQAFYTGLFGRTGETLAAGSAGMFTILHREAASNGALDQGDLANFSGSLVLRKNLDAG
jgi:predicted enzyme related to lactoylglutathione lyase